MFKKPDLFIILLIFAIGLAYFVPFSQIGIINLSTVCSWGISFIFFFYGVKLNLKQLKSDLSNFKLHILVQGATFLIFPVIVILIKPFFSLANQTLWLALFFLSALPSTVSSSVVMVSIAKGNIPSAIFNATLSGLIGIIITPLWMSLFIRRAVGDFDFSGVIINLIQQILLPVILGLFMHKWWSPFFTKHKHVLAWFDKSVILLVVYNSFGKSFTGGVFDSFGVWQIVMILAIVVSLFFIVYGIIDAVAKLGHFSQADRITALFCGSKKSLVHGTVMVNVLFAGMGSIGLFLVPVMMYHAFQLVIISFFANRFFKYP